MKTGNDGFARKTAEQLEKSANDLDSHTRMRLRGMRRRPAGRRAFRITEPAVDQDADQGLDGLVAKSEDLGCGPRRQDNPTVEQPVLHQLGGCFPELFGRTLSLTTEDCRQKVGFLVIR